MWFERGRALATGTQDSNNRFEFVVLFIQTTKQWRNCLDQLVMSSIVHRFNSCYQLTFIMMHSIDRCVLQIRKHDSRIISIASGNFTDLDFQYSDEEYYGSRFIDSPSTNTAINHDFVNCKRLYPSERFYPTLSREWMIRRMKQKNAEVQCRLLGYSWTNLC